MRHLLFGLGIAASLATLGCGNEMVVADAAAPGTDAPLMCVDVSGVYGSSLVGCDDVAGIASTEVTIDLAGSCAATFTSVAPKARPPVNGAVTLRADGSFGPTDLTIGDETRSCSGAPGAGTYVVTCGACVITLSPPT